MIRARLQPRWGAARCYPFLLICHPAGVDDFFHIFSRLGDSSRAASPWLPHHNCCSANHGFKKAWDGRTLTFSAVPRSSQVSQRTRVIAICENSVDLNLFFDSLRLAVDKVIHHHDVYAANVIGTRRDVASGDSYSGYYRFIKLDAEKREIAI